MSVRFHRIVQYIVEYDRRTVLWRRIISSQTCVDSRMRVSQSRPVGRRLATFQILRMETANKTYAIWIIASNDGDKDASLHNQSNNAGRLRNDAIHPQAHKDVVLDCDVVVAATPHRPASPHI